MDCFGNYQSRHGTCQSCWLRDCCKFTREEKEVALLKKIRSKGLIVRCFDGDALSEKKIGYDESLEEYLHVA